jgi:WD40-like Beta Propeller Repeat
MALRLVLTACVVATMGCKAARKESAVAAALPSPPYFGQPTPGVTPEKFAPGAVSTDAIELNGVFTPDGRELFFTRIVDGIDTIHHSVFRDGKWSDPKPLSLFPGGARAVAVDMSVSPDGRELYFLGQYRQEPAQKEPGSDIWVSRRADGGWATATLVPAPVSTSAEELYPVVVADGSLFFSSNREDGKHLHLYRAPRQGDGSFSGPTKLGPPIADEEFGTGDTFVAPDESYMILSSRRPPGFGNGDLFVAFRQKDGRWGTPVNLGPAINTSEHEFCPMATPDGKFLFFSRRWGATWETTTAGDLYWVDARVLDQFRSQS